MPINIYAPTSADNLSLAELDLYHLIMEYRAEEGLPAIPLSSGLTLTAGRHSLDQYHNIEVPGGGLPEGANMHSWSDRPYMTDGSTLGAMTNAPQRLQSGYNDPGYEISAFGQPDVAGALEGWKLSPGHDTVIRNAGPWTGIGWGAIGIGVEMNDRVESGPIRYGNYYNVWFGQANDPGGPPLIEGTTAADSVRGTGFADLIAAGGGDDTIHGHGGNDRIELGGGNNVIYGGAGTDTLVASLPSTAVDVALAGGAMQITLGPHVSTLHGMERLEFANGTFEMTAGGLEGVDPVPAPNEPTRPTEPVRNVAPPSDNVQALPMHSEGGNTGNPGMSPGGEGRRVVGDDGDNVIGGPSTDDTLNGGGGDDTISGGDGWDLIAGGSGNDTIAGGNGNDMIGGGFGDDKIVAGAGRDTIGGGRGDDSINGGLEDDVIAGGAGNDVIFGESGDDVIGASYGDDTVSGGDGNDNLGGGTGKDILAGHDGDDSIGGGEGDDLVGGGNGNDFLAGGGRDDTILGGSGDDTINGGEGDDHMYGGAGADVFVFNGFTDGDVDRIYDFDDGVDALRLRGVSGNNTQERIEALDITYIDFNHDGGVVAGARLTHDGHTIEIAGIAAEDLGVGDFIFI